MTECAYRCSFCLEELLSGTANLKIHHANVILVQAHQARRWNGDRFSASVLNLMPGVNSGCCAPILHDYTVLYAYPSMH